jgi:hypothetical protein
MVYFVANNFIHGDIFQLTFIAEMYYISCRRDISNEKFLPVRGCDIHLLKIERINLCCKLDISLVSTSL